jgi:hypothetical protein
MVTLTIILLLVFVPASRRLLVTLVYSVLGALGVIAAVTRDSPRRKW